MSKPIAYCILLVFAGVALALVACKPDWVSDENYFMKNFVNHEFLNVLGVTLAITLASAANLHLQFNMIEERFNAPGALKKSRADLQQAAMCLIALFAIAVAIVVVKPIAVSSTSGSGPAFFNMAALFMLLWHILLLLSLVQLVFAIPPMSKEDEDDHSISMEDEPTKKN